MPRAIHATVVALFACGLVFTACNDDSVSPKKDPPPGPSYEDLSEEWHVFNNLELCYNERNLAECQKLLDADNFLFYFGSRDVGGDVPPSWGYAEEVQATENMFSGDGGRDNNPILSIELTLADIEKVQWEDYADEDAFPNETLRRGTVAYDFAMTTANDLTWITPGQPRAEFVVRNVGGKWRIVEWRDLAGELASAVAASTEESSWGKVKSRYQ